MSTLTHNRPQATGTPITDVKAYYLGQLHLIQAHEPDKYAGLWWLFRQTQIWERLAGPCYRQAVALTRQQFQAQLRRLAVMDEPQRQELQRQMQCAAIAHIQESVKHEPEFLSWLAQHWARQARRR